MRFLIVYICIFWTLSNMPDTDLPYICYHLIASSHSNSTMIHYSSLCRNSVTIEIGTLASQAFGTVNTLWICPGLYFLESHRLNTLCAWYFHTAQQELSEATQLRVRILDRMSSYDRQGIVEIRLWRSVADSLDSAIEGIPLVRDGYDWDPLFSGNKLRHLCGFSTRTAIV